MDRRLALAFLLTAIVVLLMPILFPPARRPPRVSVDTLGARVARDSAIAATLARDTVVTTLRPITPMAESTVPSDSHAVATELASYQVRTAGAALSSVRLRRYQALGGDRGSVTLGRSETPLVRYRLVAGSDTILLDRLPFNVVSGTQPAGTNAVTLRGATPVGTLQLRYTFQDEDYVIRVDGALEPPPSLPVRLLVTVPHGVRSEEADTVDDQRFLAAAFKPVTGEAHSIPFGKLKAGEQRAEPGPLTWAVSKNKYFLVSLLTPAEDARPFDGALVAAGPRGRGLTPTADLTVVQALPEGRFHFEIYAGPQEWRRLRALGRDMEHANPYGGFMRGVVQPFATIVMRALLWLHDTLRLSYGWVLVIFGVGVRLLIWPLQQRAMRSSMRMQQVQPLMLEIQKKYRNDPQRQQQEMVKLYKEHQINPLSFLGGCLPVLIPMPVFLALFFVFQNTIEFRGVPFLWLSDISLKDPYYILPLVMGASMFLLSWIGMRNMPPNPQAKMMTYLLPAVFTFALLNFASGLNLYYTVQNIVSLPQQWLIAKERAKTTPPRRT